MFFKYYIRNKRKKSKKFILKIVLKTGQEYQLDYTTIKKAEIAQKTMSSFPVEAEIKVISDMNDNSVTFFKDNLLYSIIGVRDI